MSEQIQIIVCVLTSLSLSVKQVRTEKGLFWRQLRCLTGAWQSGACVDAYGLRCVSYRLHCAAYRIVVIRRDVRRRSRCERTLNMGKLNLS